ncbi:MAG: phytoene/squalene synthase family protein [Bacteroidota bacterium]|nr:phytoene/squalene synthase family protein [Bacteroidota bacterium]
MKSLFDQLSVKVSKATTKAYSTSFSLGIYFLNNSLRDAIYSIYGFVRLADEIVDSFTGYDQKKLLAKFTEETYDAIENKISVNPVLNSFQHAVNQYKIEQELIEVFLKSMEMDLQKVNYTEEKYQQYILGSAEVVGLMCLRVFTHEKPALYEELKPYAMRLGAAFQKVNFLRDMKDDYVILGRTYFPDVNMAHFSGDVKKQIEEDIEHDFKTGLAGIKKLPASSKGGVYLAYVYYQSLFKKIKKLPAHKILNERIRINNGKKLGLMINSLVINKMNLV